MNNESTLPLGKLPPELLKKIISSAPILDDRVVFGPGIGLDCAVIDAGEKYMVLKTDPITFASDEIGWYAVQINTNDIVTTGAIPKWFLATVLLPENKTDEKMVESISQQLFDTCRKMNISFIGGHTEVTYGIDRPIISGTLIGEVKREELITPRGVRPGDHILLTKGVPIEATAILSREFPERLSGILSQEELTTASNYLKDPGISVYKDARIAVQSGKVSGMHDPTEGGVAAALWEMAEASGLTFNVDLNAIHVPELSRRICHTFNLDPLATIASGALLLTVDPRDSQSICKALEKEHIACAKIGEAEAGEYKVNIRTASGIEKMLRPARDEITKAYE
ncbi:MAG: AIR synthase family protein [Anaerolineaceae bacterium]|nr:AIR synthase family protein [Anaerolineaceae bacterium]